VNPLNLKIKLNRMAQHKIIGIFCLIMLMAISAGSAIEIAQEVGYLSYLLFLIILIAATNSIIRTPLLTFSVGIITIFTAIISELQYAFLILPLVVLTSTSLQNKEEVGIIRSNIHNRLIISFCSLLILVSIYRHGFSAGIVRTELFRDPNFFALFFLILAIPFILGGRSSQIISLLLIFIVVYLTLSRALVLGTLFILAASVAMQLNHSCTVRISCLAAIILSATYPFISDFAYQSHTSSYSTGIERLFEVSDQSNLARFQGIIYTTEAVIDNNLFFYGLSESELPQPPPNWFWLLAIRFGLIGAIIFSILLLTTVIRAHIRIAVIISFAALSSGFLDFHPLVSVLYAIVTYQLVTGQMLSFNKSLRRASRIGATELCRD
jgi:hypothetical protein